MQLLLNIIINDSAMREMPFSAEIPFGIHMQEVSKTYLFYKLLISSLMTTEEMHES